MRTRFAPSPTGLLHVGGLRTALYAYLVAKQSKGAFILRIEDTDQERTVLGAVENILSTLTWAGLEPDEGVVLQDKFATQTGAKGPYIQSERLELYKKYALELVEKGHAYYAFDTRQEIDQMREDQKKAGNPSPKYDSTVRMSMKNSFSLDEDEVKRRLENKEDYVIRLKVPEMGTVTFTDDIRGKLEFKGHTIDDQVLLKSDGFPTYHLAHVVDDHLMDIGLVLRGEEWLSSLPKHLLLFEALGWKAPRYAHVPLLLNKDKTKLSKRQNDVAAEDYISQGYLPEALINFLALLGWNPGTTDEIFTLKDLVDQFSLERVQKGGAIFDREKLDWLQGQWIRRFSTEEFAARALEEMKGDYPEAANDTAFTKKAALIQERLTFFKEVPSALSFFYKRPEVSMELLANKKQKVTEDMVPEILALLTETLEAIDEKKWNEENLKETLFALAKEKDLKNGQILWPLRATLTGLPYSPGAFEVAEVLGKEEVIARLKAAS